MDAFFMSNEILDNDVVTKGSEVIICILNDLTFEKIKRLLFVDLVNELWFFVSRQIFQPSEQFFSECLSHYYQSSSRDFFPSSWSTLLLRLNPSLMIPIIFPRARKCSERSSQRIFKWLRTSLPQLLMMITLLKPKNQQDSRSSSSHLSRLLTLTLLIMLVMAKQIMTCQNNQKYLVGGLEIESIKQLGRLARGEDRMSPYYGMIADALIGLGTVLFGAWSS